MPDVRSTLTAAVAAALEEMGADADPAVERSARPELGDWSSPAPLRAARSLRRPPPAIAEELRERLAAARLPAVSEWTVTAPGYVNARLEDAVWAPDVIGRALARDPSRPLGGVPGRGRTLVEHTNINTNKAAHIGHLRNACIGDTMARILRRTGHEVEVDDYIDDTGVQVADVVVGVRELGIAQREGEPFDSYCSRVYVEVSRRQRSDPGLEERRRAVLRAIEEGSGDVAAFAKELSTRVVRAHLATMARVGVRYDVLTWESDILRLGFWDHAFRMLRDSGRIVLATSGRNRGCWVLPGDSEDDDKVLVKSDGIATYTAKDIAYQLWKLGLLGRDFGYRRWDEADPSSPYTTTSEPADAPRRFGGAGRVINVIDSRQAYLQGVVQKALAALGYEEAARNSVHLAYEVVALSPAAAAVLGVETSGPGPVALSGREGIEVRADDLLDSATATVAAKAADEATAAAIAAGAVRYYLLRFSLNQVIAFDFDEALRTTGDTGVYLQYAHARASGILRKAPEEGDGPVDTPAPLHPVERELLHRIDGYDHAVAEAARCLEPVVLTTYAFSLASALSDFYEHTPPVVREADPRVRRFRRALVAATRATLADALTTLGIPAPERV